MPGESPESWRVLGEGRQYRPVVALDHDGDVDSFLLDGIWDELDHSLDCHNNSRDLWRYEPFG